MENSNSEPKVVGRVGLLGGSYAGKTTYFAALDRALKNRDWRVLPFIENGKLASQHLQETCGEYLDDGYFPEKTPDQIPSEGLYYHISKGKWTIELAFYDPPGEMFEPGTTSNQDVQKVVFDSMRTATGILVLLSPARTPYDLQRIWKRSIVSLFKHVKQNDISGLIDGDVLAIRTAVVFTKADQLPWVGRHRPCDAEPWLESSKGLQNLAKDIRSVTKIRRFFFCSSVGWNEGCQNCRTTVRPRELPDVSATDVITSESGDLIPDPGYRPKTPPPAGERWRSRMPMFSDPMQIVNPNPDDPDDLNKGRGPDVGIITLPGREPPAVAGGDFLTPWNLVKPLLWAAGCDET